MIPLRDFLFIDTKILESYLSAMEGYIETEQERVDSETSHAGAKAEVKIAGADISRDKEKQVTSKRGFTKESRFQNFYEKLEKENQIKHLDLFDEEYWKNIQKGDILEIQANIKLSEIQIALSLSKGVADLAELGKTIGIDIKEDDLQIVQKMVSVSEWGEKKPLPIIFEAVNTPKYQFVARLPREYITCNIQDLQGEAVVFGKVLRFIEKGQKLELENIASDLLATVKLNRAARRKLASSKNKDIQAITDTVKGPAIVLIPLAIYR